ncbi:MAG: hypothetical protein JNL10_14365 [Verrucomicrobiales bacterium]|nr:hypothetical protein [Verrucomicrobiales bacterium]
MNATTIPLPEVRTLADLASRASAALIPLASDGEGRDSHGGAIRNPQETLDGALGHLIEAGTLAAQLRQEAARLLRP